MTSLAVTLSVDSRGPCGLYIFTDSRITWGSQSGRWDAGQKAFASSYSADVFGFCGDAFFPPSVLRQVIELIDARLLFDASASAEHRHNKAVEVFRSAIKKRFGAPIKNFSIIHGSRNEEFMASSFRVWKTQFTSQTSQTEEWDDQELNLDDGQSYVAHIDGSGAATISRYVKKWDATLAKDTSRAAMWALFDALHSKSDKHSGGPPQLVGIWRKGAARQFGLIWDGKKYLCAVEVPGDSKFGCVGWFNQNFERYDGEKKKRLPGAQRQPKPPPQAGC